MKPQPLFFTGRNYIVPDDAPKKFHDCDDIRECCPHGFPGDRLWVRETWGHTGTGVWTVGDAQRANSGKVVYRADDKSGVDGWFPSIHMPRRFSRINLQVTDVRVQRLHDISEEDAKAEGVEPLKSGRGYYSVEHGRVAVRFGIYHDFAKEAFAELWSHINGADSWNANPWVWAISFSVESR